MADKIPDISPNVDETMKELETHGSFELPVETYTDNCEIFRSLYNHWHKEMEIICIDKGNGLARLNRETTASERGRSSHCQQRCSAWNQVKFQTYFILQKRGV